MSIESGYIREIKPTSFDKREQDAKIKGAESLIKSYQFFSYTKRQLESELVELLNKKESMVAKRIDVNAEKHDIEKYDRLCEQINTKQYEILSYRINIDRVDNFLQGIPEDYSKAIISLLMENNTYENASKYVNKSSSQFERDVKKYLLLF